MKKQRVLALVTGLALAATVGATQRLVQASDHDDGETDIKARALNLTDHYAFKSGTDLALVMSFNPRSLPGTPYFLSTNARYEFHVSKVASRTAAPTAGDDFVFRFEAGAANAAGVQPITLTILKDGVVVGTNTGASTAFAASQANTVTANAGTVGTFAVKYFAGQRNDSFTFDVVRYFQVRAFLASRFFGGAGGAAGTGNATAALAPNCRGDAFLGLEGADGSDADTINLFNPPSCAPDFTKNLNVTSIVLNVPIASLGGGTIFDTWSTISVGE